MDDLISRKDAIDALGEEPLVWDEWTDEYNLGMQTLWVVAKRDIESLPSIDAEPQWIPCDEQLPEVRQWVLCSCRAGIMDVLQLTNDGSWDKDYPYVEYRSDFVVAWMPLPKPYGREGS